MRRVITPAQPAASGSPPRVFLGLGEIAGYYHGLRQGLRELGIPVTYACLEEHPFKYDDDTDLLPLVVAIRQARLARRRPGPLKLRKFLASSHEKILRRRLLHWAAERHDVFIFGYKRTFSKSFADLAWLRRRGKKVVCIFHGSDSRPPYLDGSLLRAENNISVEECIRLSRRQEMEVRAIEAQADLVVVNPYSAHFHRRNFVSFFALGLPCLFGPQPDVSPPRATDTAIRILHCPSHPESKGTPTIRTIMSELKTRGLSVEYSEIINLPNASVQEALRRCDFVVDQLYSDTPMAGLAAEAAAWGKPTVVGSYAAKLFAPDIPAEFLPPSAACHPDDLPSTVERLVKDSSYRQALGNRAREFIARQWNHRSVAGRFRQLIERDPPAAWTGDPQTIQYLHGYGMPEEKVRRQVRALVERGGSASLGLGDKPRLEKLMVSFARQS
jgi:glycosyltransferase involved in cell wall biosynthesis